MSPLKPGKLLSAEQSLRLTILDNVSREQAIEFIVKHLRRGMSRREGVGAPTMRTQYQRPMR